MRSVLLTCAAVAFATTSAALPGARLNRDSFSQSSSVRREVAPEPYLQPKSEQSNVLKPINSAIFESALGIEARDNGVEFDNLPPATQAQMVFGSPGNNGQMYLANMTLYAEDGLPIVMMERFEGLTSAVDCEGDDGRLSLTFRSQEAYDKAIDSWSYINEDTEREFLMIMNHAGCGPDEERQAYRVTDVDNEEASLNVYLSAAPAAWNEIAGTFDLDFGRASMTHAAQRALKARGWFDWVDDAVDAVGDTVSDVADAIAEVGDGELSESVDIPISIGEEGVETLLFEDYTTNPPQLKLYCSNCFISGTFETKGSIKVENFIPDSLLLEVFPQDFRAAVELKAEFAQANPDAEWLDWEKTLFEAPIPYAGIVIPKVLTLGAKFEFKLAGRASVIGRATLTVGAETSLPNGARVAVDMVNYENSGVSGFDTIDFDPIFDVDKASITANLAAGPKMALVLGVEVLDNTGIEASLTFGTPTFNINATYGYDENGFCEGSTETTGIEIVSAANFDMSLAIEGKVDDDDHTFFSRRLVNIPLLSFLDKCWEFGDSGDEPNPTSGAPTPTSAAPTPTYVEPTPTDVEPTPTQSYPPDSYPTDVSPTDVYYRNDCDPSTNGTTSALARRATPTACATVPVVKFSCKDFPNACKNMCFNRYCKGLSGAYPDYLHRGATNSGDVRRTEGGYMKPSQSKQPCNPANKGRVTNYYNEVAAWTSMDEFAMAVMVEGGLHGSYGAGFRCIDQRENSRAGGKMKNLMNAAGITGNNIASASNAFDIEFTDIGYIEEDYCDTDAAGNPLSLCINDGYQFVAKQKDTGSGFDYLLVNDGQGWTGTN